MAAPNGTGEKLRGGFSPHRGQLSPATIRRAASEVGGITDFDAQYPKVLPTVKADASVGTSLGVTGRRRSSSTASASPGRGGRPSILTRSSDWDLNARPRHPREPPHTGRR